MKNNKYILALDQGTTSSKGVILDQRARLVAVSDNYPIEVRSPAAGWIEYDPREMLNSLVSAGRDVLEKAGLSPGDITMAGLANQGETVIAFDKMTGQPSSPAVSWQDRRTTGIVEQWQSQGWSKEVSAKTGLKLDPYFSAAKIRWILENVPEVLELLQKAQLCVATSDTWLISRLTGLSCCVTDISTASRTMLLNLETLDWDLALLDKFRIPRAILPDLVGNTECIGTIQEEWFGGEIPLGGLCVDQQAALFGQQCLKRGEAKLTYGTGCFMLGNIGSNGSTRSPDLLTSAGWRTGGVTSYVFDGGIYMAGALIDWMINRLHLLKGPDEIDLILADSPSVPELFFIPALSGLAAPYWEPKIRGGWFGLSLAHDRRALIKSAVESIGFRVVDIFKLMVASGLSFDSIKVDGGLARSRFLMQLQCNLLGIPVEVQDSVEATAIGVGLMAGLTAGMFSSTLDFPELSPARVRYLPDDRLSKASLQRYERWKELVGEVARWPERDIGVLS